MPESAQEVRIPALQEALIMKQHLCLMVSVLLAGCGSVTTLATPDEKIVATLAAQGSHCASIPRVYSGVVYNFCTLNSAPGAHSPAISVKQMLFDTALSSVVDTLFLPYTVYGQIKKGSLPLSAFRPVFQP